MRRPGRLVRHAMWGVRLGWLAQTALLVAQAATADGFPWGSWAGSLNLFVWMCVGAYLVWGCRAPFRLLGLAVMPLAAALLVLAWAAGGVGRPARSEFGDVFLAFHVGLILAAFAGFTLAAALAVLYLVQERRLKRRAPGVLRLRFPSLETLDALTVRTIALALPALTVGIGIGLARLEAEGGGFDAIMGLTLLTWAVYAAFLVLRWEAGWRGRRTAHLALAGFLLVVLVRLVLTPFLHF
ncbi:MAG TPA: cytochrome c biogenesis protein CcsA [Gaiellaceae bacterium]|nr:cytochrome c biogenesis protein CcsA [Gaiellaceae bacterium]